VNAAQRRQFVVTLIVAHRLRELQAAAAAAAAAGGSKFESEMEERSFKRRRGDCGEVTDTRNAAVQSNAVRTV
jgi:hypothetical protein